MATENHSTTDLENALLELASASDLLTLVREHGNETDSFSSALWTVTGHIREHMNRAISILDDHIPADAADDAAAPAGHEAEKGEDTDDEAEAEDEEGAPAAILSDAIGDLMTAVDLCKTVRVYLAETHDDAGMTAGTVVKQIEKAIRAAWDQVDRADTAVRVGDAS
jgi:hypothetical protein